MSEHALVPYNALTMDLSQLQDAVLTNTGGQGLNPFDLDRVKIPAGGSLSWTVPSLKGDEEIKTLQGIVIKWKDTRSYWPDPFSGEGVPPRCSSDDSVVGHGDPGGLCATCPFAQFGSANPKPGSTEHGRGQACKQTRMLFLLRPTDIIPLLIILPPTSLKPAKQYFLRLLSAGMPSWSVETAVSLQRAKSGDGIMYSQAVFTMVRPLPADSLDKLKELARTLAPLFERAKVTREDVYGPDEA